jgi:hypothetical protein
MKRNYKLSITDLPILSHIIEINDPPYYPEDLYEIIGTNGFVVTFIFRQGTDSEKRYGNSITCSIFYPKGVREQIKKSICENTFYKDQQIRVNLILPRLPQSDKEELKYNGFPIDHVQSMDYVPYKNEAETVSDLKIVIKIPISKTDFDVDEDVFTQNVLLRKLRLGTELIPEEKAHLIGSILAMDQNQFDPELLSVLGYTIETAGTDRRIWFHYYQTKKRRKTLSEGDVQKLKDVESEDLFDKVVLLEREIASGHEPGEIVSFSNDQLTIIMNSLKNFHPHVLIPIRRQIWWNTKSYLHIVLRHIRDLQIGKLNQRKTPFPYAFEELRLLIEKVIDSVIGEIKTHFDTKKTPGPFFRSGKMCVLYNEDYYSFHINEDGLLENIHIVEDH